MIPLPELISSTCKQPEEPRPAVDDGTLLRLDTERAYIKRINILAILAKMQLALNFDPGRDVRGGCRSCLFSRSPLAQPAILYRFSSASGNESALH